MKVGHIKEMIFKRRICKRDSPEANSPTVTEHVRFAQRLRWFHRGSGRAPSLQVSYRSMAGMGQNPNQQVLAKVP